MCSVATQAIVSRLTSLTPFLAIYVNTLHFLLTILVSFSSQTNHVETPHPFLTRSCMVTLGLKWGMSCFMFVLRATSWATKRLLLRCSVTAVGNGMGKFRPVSKVSLSSIHTKTPLNQSCQQVLVGLIVSQMVPDIFSPQDLTATVYS